jgi:hypothetical protein
MLLADHLVEGLRSKPFGQRQRLGCIGRAKRRRLE